MPKLDTTSDAASSTAASEKSAGCIRTDLDAAGALEAARKLSQQGKLPGFVAGDASGAGVLFRAAAFGKPFDSELVMRAEPQATGGCLLRGEVRLKRGLPAVFAVVLVLTIWPGVLLTDSLMNTWFGWYPNATWITYAWYIPLTVLPLPWMVKKTMRQSRASAAAHAAETIEKIRIAVAGELI